MIRVLFFAGLREKLDCASLDISVEGLATLADLRGRLGERGDHWRRALEDNRLQMALNQNLATADSPVAAGDEVAFFPPVTGG